MASFNFVPTPTSSKPVRNRTVVGATDDTFLIEQGRTYTLWLKGKDSAGADYTGCVAVAAGATAPTTADESAQDNKVPLRAGEIMVLGPEETQYTIKVSAGNPVLVIMPGPKQPLRTV